jgi:hypothetical protein
MVSCTDPTWFSCGDIANLDGLGGTRCGVAGGSLSEDELISMDESESTAYAFSHHKRLLIVIIIYTYFI